MKTCVPPDNSVGWEQLHVWVVFVVDLFFGWFFCVCVCFVFVWFWFFLKKIKLVDIRLSQLCALAMSKAKVLAASATM